MSGTRKFMHGGRKRGLAPALVLVPAVASCYFMTGCGPESTAAGPESPITTVDWPTRTTTRTTEPTTTQSTTSPAPATVTSAPPTDPDPDFAAVCADAVTGLRVDDTDCDNATDDYLDTDTSAATYAAAGLAGGAVGAAMWYYFSVRNRATAPAIGAAVHNGTYTTPHFVNGRSPVIYRTDSIPRTGGPITKSTIHRGGLGLRPHSSSS
ncbi:hypothetical protein [Nocardia macrotermitis]|uniref:Uncharacterized protein n=1 Tax=Nocardia macrotermitis TaxID=2585198 RepID=A0A7K0DA55_9NOCA|nr:hypothetical protein [Nocardia macrotermitis]MQY22441.1 hypothetical protein [Nocardia macrotermitis]